MIIQQSFPQVSAPLVDPNSGKITQTWLQLLITLFNRTGQSQGNTITDPTIIAIMADEDGAVFIQNQSVAPIVTISVGSSPFAYTASRSGSVWISPGTYTDVQLKRGITTLDFGYVTRGIFPVAIGDTITVTYTLTPTMYFIP